MIVIIVKEYKCFFGVVCVGVCDSYIFGDNNIIVIINIKGRIKNRFFVECWFWLESIVVNKYGELIYVDSFDRKVKKFSKIKNKILVIVLEDCILNFVCCFRLNIILVFMFCNDRNMIYCYEGKKNM